MTVRYAQFFRGLLTAMCLMSVAATARADSAVDPEGYRQAVEQGSREFELGNFLEARAAYARANAIFPNARTQRGLGLAEYELRNYVASIRHLEAALRSDVRPLDAALHDEVVDMLERARGFVGSFIIQTTLTPSKLIVDGYDTALPLDRKITLQIGDHVIELLKAHYQPEKRLLTVKGGEREVILKIDYGSPSSSAPRESQWYENPWLWATVGVVVAGAATTAIVLAAAGGKGNAADPNLVVIKGP